MNILIADDELTIRLVLAATLKKLGHEVVACANGADASRALQESYFPVLITDWAMPELDGLRLTETVRAASPHRAYTYVIMLTAHGARDDYLSSIAAGADAFLVKSLDEILLEAQLRIAERIVGLQNHAKQLESIMTVCSYCRNVRTGDDAWVSMERYVDVELNTKPSHTICPSCYVSKVEPELARLGI